MPLYTPFFNTLDLRLVQPYRYSCTAVQHDMRDLDFGQQTAAAAARGPTAATFAVWHVSGIPKNSDMCSEKLPGGARLTKHVMPYSIQLYRYGCRPLDLAY